MGVILLQRLLWRGLAVMVVLAMIGSSAIAATVITTKKIDVVYRGIKIYVDGRLITPTVEPFIVASNGTTMVPLRAIAEAVGRNVAWDEKTSSIYLTGGATAPVVPTPSQVVAPVVTPDPEPQFVLLSQIRILRNVGGGFYRQVSKPMRIAGREFVEGIGAVVDDTADKQAAEMVVDLAGKYSRIAGFVGVDDETRNSKGGYILYIKADDRQIYRSHLIYPAQYPFYIELNVQDVKRLAIIAEWQEISKIGDSTKVIPALVDFRLYP